jgi:hypothetical protein
MMQDLRQSLERLGSASLMLLGSLVVAGMLPASQARAEKIENPIAVFAALDKVTGRISPLEIRINDTVEFGALKVTPRVCTSTPPTEAPRTTAFVEIDETKLTGEIQRIFTGWMFAESPGLNAVEHPVFDVWLTSCKKPIGGVPAESAENEDAEAPAEAAAAAPAAPTPPAAPPAAAPARPASPPPAGRPAPARPLLPWLQR